MVSTSVFALYEDVVDAEQAVDSLISAGCLSDDISILISKPPVKGAGGTLGLLAGFGSIVMADSTQMVAAGPIWSTLSLGDEDHRRWGLKEALSGLGLPSPHVGRYAADIRNGWVLVSIRCGIFDDVERVTSALRTSGGKAIAPVAGGQLKTS